MKKGIFVTTLSLVLVLGTFAINASTAKAAGTSPVDGYAWSSAFGWVSFNCSNSNSCARVNYGVAYDKTTGALSGYAWSSNLGWISFQPGDVSGCPVAPCAPKVVDGKLTGWAKILSGRALEGWEGWIHLSGSNYGVDFDGTKFTGYAWSYNYTDNSGQGVSSPMGYFFKFNPAMGPGVYTLADADITTGVVGGGTNSSVLVQTDVCKSPTCTFSYEANKVIDLLANPAPGYYFSSWTGADSNLCSNPSSRFCYNITLDSNKEIKAQFRSANCPNDGPAACPVCNDGVDNDNDGDIDYPNDKQCAGPSATTESDEIVSACNDCIDNDGDGLIDWLDDPGCNDDPADNNETDAKLTVSVVEDGPSRGKVISDIGGIDCGNDCTHIYTNDEEVTLTALPQGPRSLFDHWEGACTGTEPKCVVKMDRSRTAIAYFISAKEANCPKDGPNKCPECNDGVDDDLDGFKDYPKDPNCKDLEDDSEEPVVEEQINCPADGPGLCPECNDGVDNDGDGQIDFPADKQCVSLDDNSEGIGPNCPADGPGICPQCYDGVDNDRDGDIDYPEDKGCFNRADDNETDVKASGNCPADGPGICPQCNDGIDNEGDGFVDWDGWDADKDGFKEIKRDPSCQGEPDKNTESGSFIEVER